MCTADGVPGDAGFSSAAEALRAGVALADYLNSPAAADLEPAVLGEALVSIGEIQSELVAARAGFLRRFDGADAHDADGYGSSSSWLAAMSKLTKKDAKAAVRQMRVLGERPLLARGPARGELSDSWAREIAAWLKRLPEELRDGTEEILAEAAAGGASLDDLATIVAHALAQSSKTCASERSATASSWNAKCAPSSPTRQAADRNRGPDRANLAAWGAGGRGGPGR